jgi:hypothetical protein
MIRFAGYCPLELSPSLRATRSPSSISPRSTLDSHGCQTTSSPLIPATPTPITALQVSTPSLPNGPSPSLRIPIFSTATSVSVFSVTPSLPIPAFRILLSSSSRSWTPLGLKDTTVSLTPEQQSRFLPGHDASHRPAHAWDQDVFAGAGAIRSTAPDMLTLAAALIQQHQLRADAGQMKIGPAWMFESHSGNYWHNGATGGYSAYAFFNP